MRDPDEMISWDDPDDVSVATLPVGFRMPDIERYTGVGCPRIHLRLYSTVMRALGLDEAQLLTLFPLSLSGMTEMVRFIRVISSENLGGLSTGVSETVFIQWEKAEMIERPTERDQMSMFLRSLHPRFARHLTGVPFQDFRSLILREGVVGSSESYGDVCSGTFSIDDLVIILCEIIADTRSDFPPLHIVILIQFSSTLLCILILSRCDLHFSFSVHRLVSHDMSSLVPIGDIGLILIWGCLWIELLSDSDLLMAGHRTDYCASLRHTIQDLIDSGAVSFPVSTTDTDLGPDMTADSFPAIPHMQFLLLRAYTIMFWTPRALIFTGHFDIP
ncbi:hypothetical protein CK203_063480 [Vitis vinifera]|uniref:Uncharacterized protein n=1 Tax=Vitis vinifera TaxID=29760 RepID=A0A438FRQ1_VITVI|nr:hypothetical protein CK203_063480 [Vitis vinifera]